MDYFGKHYIILYFHHKDSSNPHTTNKRVCELMPEFYYIYYCIIYKLFYCIINPIVFISIIIYYYYYFVIILF